jgi:CelD/BcsL family acetyltransferase involved in cellulose biosynthesis
MEAGANVEILTTLTALEALAPEWTALAAGSDLPMLSHAWVLACSLTLCAAQALRVITVRQRGALVAAAPLAQADSTGASRLELVGATALYEPSGVLYQGGEALALLLRAMLSLGQPFVLSRIPFTPQVSGMFSAAAHRRALLVSSRISATLAVPIDSSWEEYLATLSAHRRYDLRRAWRRAEEGGKVTVRVLSPRPDEVEGLMREFVRIEASGWKERNGSSLRQRPQLRAFFEQYGRLAAAAGSLRLSFLDVDETPIAAQFSVEYADRLWVLKIGYDEAWSRCSPGWLLLAETMRAAFARRLRSYEFLGTDESWLHGWRTVSRKFRTVACYPASVDGVYGLAADSFARLRARLARARSH